MNRPDSESCWRVPQTGKKQETCFSEGERKRYSVKEEQKRQQEKARTKIQPKMGRAKRRNRDPGKWGGMWGFRRDAGVLKRCERGGEMGGQRAEWKEGDRVEERGARETTGERERGKIGFRANREEGEERVWQRVQSMYFCIEALRGWMESTSARK